MNDSIKITITEPEIKRYDIPQVRPAKHKAFCRACDNVIKVNQDMVTWYSHRNRGQHIHICIKCCNNIGRLVWEYAFEEGKNK